MNQIEVTEINRRLLRNLTDRSTDMSGEEQHLPAEQFYCSQRHGVEVEHMFRQAPQVAAFSVEVKEPDDFLALDVSGVPVLLVRDQQGDLQAFINACTHRGARLADGRGSKARFICPFHGWAFSHSGALRGRPADDAFTTAREDLGLTALPVVEVAGLIVLGVSPDVLPAEILKSLSGVERELAGYGFEDYTFIERRDYNVKANWKLVTDLSLESYHFNVLHRDSVAEVLAPNAIVDTFGRHSRWAFPMKSITRLATLPESDWPALIEGSVTYTLFPSVMVIVNASGAQMIRAEPGDNPHECRVSYAGIATADADLLNARQAYDFGGDVFAREDLPIAEECQRGLVASGRPLIVGRNEPLLQFWHTQWQTLLDQME